MRHENPHYSNEIKFDDSEQNKKMKKRKISPEERKAKHKATEAQRREHISESFDALFQSLSKKDTEVSDLKGKKVKKEIKTEKEIKILNLACITIEDLKKNYLLMEKMPLRIVKRRKIIKKMRQRLVRKR